MDTSYNMHVNRAIQTIAARFKNDYIPETVTQTGPIPEYKNTFVTLVDIDNNISTNSGPNSVIDVQPDFRNIILSLNYYITKEYPDMNFKPFPAVTPPALMAYYLALFYIHALLNDDENIRTEQSKYSHAVSTTRNLDRILYKMRRYPVPPFIVEMLKGLSRGRDPRKQNLLYVNSLACFDLALDYGRTPPIMLYLAAHNIIASNQANTALSTLIDLWNNTVIVSRPTQLTVANYLGVNATPAEHLNWFAHMNRTLFNPVTNRSQTVRPTLMPVQLYAQDYTNDATNVNPYTHLLCLQDDNIVTVEETLDAISKIIDVTYPNCPQIGSLVKPTYDTLILNHYYSNMPIPTWHNMKLAAATDKPTYINAQTYASKVNFKTIPGRGNLLTVKVPALKSTFDKALYLATGEKYKDASSSIKFATFDPFTDVTPDIRHFCPHETSNEAIASNIMIGRHIEVEEITSTAVPQPNPLNTIMTENCYFLESGIPLASIRNCDLDTASSFGILQTQPHTPRQPAVRMDLIDRSIDRLPIFGPATQTAIPAILPGYHATTDIPDTRFGCNSICYQIQNGSSTTRLPIAQRSATVWSSYRYFNIHQSEEVPIRNRKLLLVNFRTLHGTNVTLVETPHPTLCISRN